MFKNSSIFTKIMIPIIIIMILQPLLIGSVLFGFGIINSLDENAIESINNNAANRSSVLSDIMVSSWSNLDKFEYDVINTFDNFLAEERLLLTDVLGSRMEVQLLELLSEPLINALRQTTATGAFVYIVNNYSDTSVKFDGLFYRTEDPLTTSPDNSDLMLLIGPAEVARQNRISFDRFWQSAFTFSPEHSDNWKTFHEPLTAAINNRFMPASELAYWSSTVTINPNNPMETRHSIIYTRPVIYEGTIIAMIGTEIQLSHIERYLPESDFAYEQCGYMLLRYSLEDEQDYSHKTDHTIVLVTGTHIRQLIGSMSTIRFTAQSKENTYRIDADRLGHLQVVFQPIEVNSNPDTPFYNDKWVVAALGTDSSLFRMSRTAGIGILVSSALALIIGITLSWLTIRRTIKPLISVAEQIEEK